MNVKKLNLRKIGLLLLVSAGLFTMSCEKEDIEIEEAEAITEEMVEPGIESTSFELKYHYNGQILNEKEWSVKFNEMGEPDISVIGYNDEIYVFDDFNKARQFENGELQIKLNEKPLVPVSVNKADPVIGSARVKFKFEFFDSKNYNTSPDYYNHYVNRVVYRKQGRWSTYLEGNKMGSNFPIAMRKKTSSYKATFIQGGSVRNFGTSANELYLSLHFRLRTGFLTDSNDPKWKKTLYDQPDIQNRKVEKDADFSNNRMWGAFGIPNWNNEIQSWDVTLR